MGTGYGGFVALSPAVSRICSASSDGNDDGTLYTSGGFGAMVGPPLGGMIIDHTGSYRGAIGIFAVALAHSRS